MKVAASSCCWWHDSLESAVRKAAAAGFTAFEALAFSPPDIKPDFDLADIQVWRPDFGIPNMGQSRLFFQGYVGEVREFVDAVREKREPWPGTEDVLGAMRVIDAMLAHPGGRSISL